MRLRGDRAGGLRTQVFRVDPGRPDSCVLEKAALIISRGGAVAFPTETVYGLGADGTSARAVERIYAAKGRPLDNPIILHISDSRQLNLVAGEVPPGVWRLVNRFWPGPLTIVLHRGKGIPDIVSAGLPTAAVRMPDHPVALGLIRAAGVPIAAPSANVSGRPSPTCAEHVLKDLEGRIDAVIDGGHTGVGVESTVLDVTVSPPAILRPGGVTREELCEVLGDVREGPGQGPDASPPRSPGMRHTHYSPEARLVLVSGDIRAVVEAVKGLAAEALRRGEKVAIMASSETAGSYPGYHVMVTGSRLRPDEVARNLFDILRAVDEEGIDTVFAESYDRAGLGAAVMDRLERAASKVIKV